METYATFQDAVAELGIVVGEQPGDYDLEAIADRVVVQAEPTLTGEPRYRIIDEDEGFWEVVIAHAIDE